MVAIQIGEEQFGDRKPEKAVKMAVTPIKNEGFIDNTR